MSAAPRTRNMIECPRGRRLGEEGRIKPPLGKLAEQRVVGAGYELKSNVRVSAVIARENWRQPACGRALECPQLEDATRRGARYNVARLVGELNQPLRVFEQQLASRRQVQPLPVAMEQFDAHRRFELLDSGGDRGWHAMQLPRRLDHTA